MTIFDHLHNIPALAIDNEGAFAIGLVLGVVVGFIAYKLWRAA